MILIDNHVFDAALFETHRRDSEVTEFPVESGADFTDHIRRLPIEVEIEGIVSDTPIGQVALLRELDGGSGVLPSEEALAKLEQIYERRQPVTIQTSKKLYERMAMTSLEIPVDRETGKALRFTATFRQIKVVTNQRIAIRAVPVAQGTRKQGQQPAKLHPMDERRRKVAAEEFEDRMRGRLPRTERTHTGTDIRDLTSPNAGNGGFVWDSGYQQLREGETNAEYLNRLYGIKVPTP
jgi:hypothetical protein